MMKTILVVEDDIALSEMLCMLLESVDFTVITAYNYAEAVTASINNTIHLVLLDWMLPGGSGIQFIQQLKRQDVTANIPIIMLTAKQQDQDQVIGLDTGADDYITKPFSHTQLLARIKAILRRSYADKDDILQFDNLQIDLKSHRVSACGKTINLGPTEYKLLHFFMNKPERVFSRDQLIDHVWGQNVYIDDRTIDVHIGRLRKQLEQSGYNSLIQTVRGAGYRLSLSTVK